jgi:hypothetical protein
MEIPEKEQELVFIREEMQALAYQIDTFRNPAHLMALAHRPEFAHLKYPLGKEVMTVSQETLVAARHKCTEQELVSIH